MNNDKRNTILIIDDEPANIITLRHILSPDYIIFGVTDGMSGITAAKLQVPDLILLDIIMPDMDGYEVLARLKGTKETQEIPVIIITQLSSDESEEKGLILGAEDYIHKPFSSLIVKLRVQNLVKAVLRNRAINSLLQQQTMLKNVSKSFFIDPDKISLFNNTLRNVGDLLGLSRILLYLADDDNFSLFTCQSEWLDPGLEPKFRLGDKLVFNDALLKVISDLILDSKGDLCLNSNNPYHKEIMTPYYKDNNSFILVPVFFMGNVNAIIHFSKEEDGVFWDESELNFAVLFASVFAKVFERKAMEDSFSN